VKFNPIGEKKTTKERMRGKRKPPEEKCEEEYPKARGWSGNDFRAGGESFRWIILQEADLLGALLFLLQELGLDPVADGGRVGVRGFHLFCGGAPVAAPTAVELLLPMRVALNGDLTGMGGKMRHRSGAQGGR
jgi:hypothetical protein